jgi:acyl-CoA thioester hydrolase
MPRIKIEMPATKLAELMIPVRISDINYGNHVGNDAFVSIIHEARVQWLQQNNFTELNFAGVGLIMGDLTIEFKSESFYGDVITVSIFSGEISTVSFELYYQLNVKRNDLEITVANAKTSMICFNYERKKPVALNEEIKRLLSDK